MTDEAIRLENKARDHLFGTERPHDRQPQKETPQTIVAMFVSLYTVARFGNDVRLKHLLTACSAPGRVTVER